MLKDEFQICPKKGLQNIGALRYMNATLQCFCHIEKFLNFFKYYPEFQSKFSNKNTLSYSFKLLIDNLWPNDYDKKAEKQSYFAPNEFKEKISKMNPLFEGIAANDAKDLVKFIIMTLHEELNKAKKEKINNDVIIDQTNQQLIFQHFAEHFTANNQSIISDLFYSTNYSITACHNCSVRIYNYQIYYFIIFPLEEVRKFKLSFHQNNNIIMINNCFINNMNNINNINNMNMNEVNLYDCFNYYCKINVMDGENSIYCNYCKRNSPTSMEKKLVTGPEILILLLNRGKGIEFNVKIYFYEFLDLSNYIEYKQYGCYYELIGVITHIGESNMSGHFIAYCRDPISGLWNKYNDAIVTPVNNFQKEVIDFGMPYILFYQKVE